MCVRFCGCGCVSVCLFLCISIYPCIYFSHHHCCWCCCQHCCHCCHRHYSAFIILITAFILLDINVLITVIIFIVIFPIIVNIIVVVIILQSAFHARNSWLVHQSWSQFLPRITNLIDLNQWGMSHNDLKAWMSFLIQIPLQTMLGAFFVAPTLEVLSCPSHN